MYYFSVIFSHIEGDYILLVSEFNVEVYFVVLLKLEDSPSIFPENVLELLRLVQNIERKVLFISCTCAPASTSTNTV